MIELRDSAPKVLIGITTYNRSAVLGKAIQSALDQSYVNKSVIVIDDASTDRTPELRQLFPSVEWIRNCPNRGLRNNRNSMMQLDGYEFFISLDDDAWFMKHDEIQIAIDRMQANPKLDAIAFDILSPDRTIEVERTPPRSANKFIGCGHVLRLESIKRLNYYENLPSPYGGEEGELCLRILDAGGEIELLPGVHVWHDKEWSDRDWVGTHRSGVCNEMVIATMRCPFPDILIVVPGKLLNFCIFWLRNPRFLRAGIMGILDFLWYFKASLKSRRPIKRSTFWKARG